jgi:lysophospholipase L1-like esterase
MTQLNDDNNRVSGRRRLIFGILFFAVAGGLAAAGLDLFSFVLPSSSRTGMSGTWEPDKLRWISTLCILASGLWAANAWSMLRVHSSQRALIGDWSLAIGLLWLIPVILSLLVYYPLPYFNHHIDKFVLALGLLLAWAAWLRVHPSGLGWMLTTRAYAWLRLALINVVVFLFVAEVSLRLADPFLAQSGLFGSAGDTPGGGIPHQVTDQSGMKTNSLGFRDRERSSERGSSAWRLVALGDSFTWGSGARYDEAYLTVVERALAGEQSGAEVINLGMVGYQPEEYYALLKEHGLSYGPDAVLVNFFIGNDFMPAQGAQMVVAGLRHRVHVNGNWFHDHLSWDHWYLSHDLAYAKLLGAAWVQRMQGKSDLGMFASDPAPAASDDPRAFTGWSSRYVRMIQGMRDQYLKDDSPVFLSRWADTKNTLEQIDELLKARAVPWVLVLLPAEEQVDSRLQRLYVDMSGGASDEYDFMKPQRLLSEWARERRIAVIDLTASFAAEAASRRLYVDNDIHWNAAGNALAARTVLNELRPLLRRATGIAAD